MESDGKAANRGAQKAPGKSQIKPAVGSIEALRNHQEAQTIKSVQGKVIFRGSLQYQGFN
jgi:hypothetical protein